MGLFQGFEVDPASELGVGNEIIFNYDPKVKLSRVIGFRLGDETERNESIEGLLPFQLDFDFFKFPHEKISPSAVLGLEQHKTSPEQQALNLRQDWHQPCWACQAGACGTGFFRGGD